MKIQLRQGENWFDVEADEVKIDGVTVAHYVFKEEIIVTKPKYEKGEWYFTESKCALFLFNGEYDKRGRPLGYGFDVTTNRFIVLNGLGWNSNGIEATKEQVENAFINHFKKLRFKSGVKFNSISTGGVYSFNGNFNFEFLFSNEEVYNEPHGMIFKAGKFAKTIKD